MAKTLKRKRQAFVNHYVQCWNASEAARRAGYSERSAGSIGHELLKKPEIQDAVSARVAELTMSAHEVLLRLAADARADMADFYDVQEDGSWKLNLNKAAALGRTHLIKKLGYNQYGPTIELVDSQAARVHLGRHHGLFVERVKSEDWQDEIIRLLEAGKLTPEQVRAELGDELAETLLKRARLAGAARGEG
jgi:phage terminase small subunit